VVLAPDSPPSYQPAGLRAATFTQPSCRARGFYYAGLRSLAGDRLVILHDQRLEIR